MLIDTHAHLHDEMFEKDQAEVIERAFSQGITDIIDIGDDMASSAQAIALAKEYKRIYAAVGIHPQTAGTMLENDEAQLAAWAQLPEVVAIGEIGLDYYYETAERSVQKQVFIRQLDVARQMHMPVSIHDRDAHGDLMDILKNDGRGLCGVIHCFSGSWEMAKELLHAGWFLGVDGPLTFKNAAKLPEIVQKIPLDHLLLETDSPYLAPVPERGHRNEPAFVRYVAEKVAVLRGISVEEVARFSSENARNLFGLSK